MRRSSTCSRQHSDRRTLPRRRRLGGRAQSRRRGHLLPRRSRLRCRLRSLPADAAQSSEFIAPTRSHADPTLAGDLDGYQLPYVDGAWATVTRSYRQHGTGRIDFDLGGTAEVTAAKDGVIVYADDTTAPTLTPAARGGIGTPSSFSTASTNSRSTVTSRPTASPAGSKTFAPPTSAKPTAPSRFMPGTSSPMKAAPAIRPTRICTPNSDRVTRSSLTPTPPTKTTTAAAATRSIPATSTPSRTSASAATRRTKSPAGLTARSSKRRIPPIRPRTSICSPTAISAPEPTTGRLPVS